MFLYFNNMEPNGKIWQAMPEINSSFIQKNPQFNRVILQLLYNRNLHTNEQIDYFLNTDFSKQILDPFLFNQMEEAVKLIIHHIKQKNKILIYGDYDADGVTASALLADTLSTLKAEVDVYIPARVAEGYGLNNKAIKEIAGNGVKLIITVDGGIRNKKEVDYAKSLKLDIIITDHHVPPEKKENLPNCLMINPAMAGEKYPFKFLAGVGVAFKLAQAIIQKSKLSADDKIKMAESNLDLLAIGTVADCVNLLGENRALVKKGLVKLNYTTRKGLKELLRAAKILPEETGKKLDAWNIGLQIGPRLNAAGRMDHANTAYQLLVTKDKDEAQKIAINLNEKNIDRQKITEEITVEVEKQIDKKSRDKIIIGICPPNLEISAWNEGVIGLVAGRISEKYNLPAIIITKTDEGLKGSGRSNIDEFNLIAVISAAGELLEKYGGHKNACGFSLKNKNLELFTKKITDIANKELKNIELMPKIKIEALVDLKEINEELVNDMEKFAPFGQGNSRPKFASYGLTVIDIKNMGYDGQHIKLRLKNENSGFFYAIGFGQAEEWKNLRLGDKIDLVYYLEMNEFNGRREAQFKIVDIKKTIKQ